MGWKSSAWGCRIVGERHRSARLPEAQGAIGGVDRQEVVQHGRPCPGESEHDDRRHHRPSDEAPLCPQRPQTSARGEGLNHVGAEETTPQHGELGVVHHRFDEDGERLVGHEVRGVVACDGDRLGDQRIR
jgi:hypothetical protein